MSSNELGFSLATYLGLGVTPASFAPCFAPADFPTAAWAKRAAPPASLNSSRRRRNRERLMISDEGIRGMASESTSLPRKRFRQALRSPRPRRARPCERWAAPARWSFAARPTLAGPCPSYGHSTDRALHVAHRERARCGADRR